MTIFVWKQIQIFRTIIISNTIDMMTFFFWSKMASKFFLHNKPMFVNITMFITKRMVGLMNKNITTGLFFLSTFPVRIILASTKFAIAFSATNGIFATKRFFTIYTLPHFSTSIKKAVFSGLKETVKFLHLLTAKFLNIKNLFPSSTYSITHFRHFTREFMDNLPILEGTIVLG